MRAEPGDLEPTDLAEALQQGWRISAAGCEYVPVGGGSYHWRVLDGESKAHWVTADDLRIRPLAELRTALETAVALRDDRDLEFVVAPLPTPAGEVLRPLGSTYAVAVYPYLEAAPLTFGQRLAEPAAAELAGLLARLHAANPASASGLRTAGAELPARDALERALGELGEPWTGGPFSEPARQAVAEQQAGIRELLSTFDDLVQTAGPGTSKPLITHGEPHPANLLQVEERLLLIDWDTVARGAAERDLWWLDGHPAALEKYERAAGRALDPVRMRLYRLRWRLDDIASFVQMFRSPHERNRDTDRWWSFAARLTREAC